MRKIVLTTLLLALLNLLVGQPFQSIFSSDTTLWKVAHLAIDNGGTIVYSSFSDTLINNKLYHKIYQEYQYTPDQELGIYIELRGYVHEDTVTGKYWFLKYIDNVPVEALFMDLNLNVGDSIAIVRDFQNMEIDSVAVDSVYYENERKIVVLQQNDCMYYIPSKVKFVEGVGSTNGFYLAEYVLQSACFILMCKFENNEQVYTTNHPSLTSCFIPGGGGVHDQDFSTTKTVFPNPFTSEFVLKSSGCGISRIQVYELTGVVVVDQKATKGMDVVVNMSDQASGMFIAKVFDTQGNVFEMKLIKQ